MENYLQFGRSFRPSASFKVKSTLLLLFSLLAFGAFAQFRFNNVPPVTPATTWGGITFNFKTTQFIRVDTIYVATSGTVGTTVNLELWYKATPINGQPTTAEFTGTSPIWTNLVTNQVVPAGVNLAPIVIPGGLLMLANSEYGFYIGNPALANTGVRYASTSAQSVFTNGIVTITSGTNTGYGWVRNSATSNHPRFYAGGVAYSNAVGGLNDAAVISVDSPKVFCAGNQNVYATVANYGRNRLDSVRVNWSFDGVTQTQVKYIGLLDTLNGSFSNTAQVLLGNKNFPAATPKTIKVWTSLPNGSPDTTNYNDTISAIKGASFSGNFTVNPSLPASAINFTSIASLNQAFSFGICGPVNVTIAAGIYTDGIQINNIKGTSSVNRITIEGVDSSTTIISAASPSFAALSISGSDYVTVKKLTLLYTGIAGSGVVLANANHNNISNCIVSVDTTNTGSGIYAISLSGSSSSHATAAITNYNTFRNNVIIGGYYGIRAYGSTSKAVVGTIVENNTFKKQYYYGAYFYYSDSLEFVKNNINMLTRGNVSAYSAYVYYTPNFKINENNLQSQGSGLYIYDFSHLFPQRRKNEIVNNMIYSGANYGLYMYYIDSTKIYHNTIVSNSATIPAIQIYSSAAIAIANYDMRNNIVYSGGSFALRTNISDAFLNELDYNAYFTSGASLFSINSVVYATLPAYVSANSSYNGSSLQGAPQFINFPANLHLLSGVGSDAGDNTVGILKDIDGDVRPAVGATTVDMGADEFTSPTFELGLTAFTSPTSGCGLTATEDVTIDILNSGQQTATNFTVGFSVNGGPFVIENIAGPLSVAASQTYTFTAKANLSAIGPYRIKVFVNIAGDVIKSNDTIVRNLTNIPVLSSFPYSESFETGAGGWTVDGGLSTFALGTPAGVIINSASNGTKAWVTNLTGNYLADEMGFVKSPCLDFTTLISPIVSMDVFWNSEVGYDGAVLQSSLDGGATWQMVGNVGDPTNWYNDNDINGLYLGTTILEASGDGWAGRTGTGSGGWLTATHDLTGLGGQSGVILRVAFGSDGSVMDEGFAFDNVKIYDKPSQDAELYSIVTPTSGCGLSSTEIVKVKVVNAGISNISNFPVAFSVNGGTPIVETVTAILLPQDTLLYTFTGTVNLSTVGSYIIKAYTGLTGDALPFNDTTNKTVVNIPVVTGFPYGESFEAGPAGWTVGGVNTTFALGIPAGALINSASNGTQAWVTNLTGNYLADEIGYVKSPCLDFSTLIAPIISMDVYWNSESGYDGAVLQSSIDGGTTWQMIGNVGDPNNWYNDNDINGLYLGTTVLEASGDGWAGRTATGSGGWVNATHQLTGLGGQPGVIFRVAFGSDGSVLDEGFAFDNVQIYESPAIDVRAMQVTRPLVGCGLTATEIIAGKFENLGTDTLTNFPVGYAVNGVAITPEIFTDTLFPGDKKVYEFTTVANLSNTIQYKIKVWSAVVGDAIPFNDTASVTFTNIAASTNPYKQTFDLLPDGAFGNYSAIKWTPIDGAFRWQAETGATSSTLTGPTADHTSGTGTYVYSEASAGTVGDTIYLESTCIDITPVNGANSSSRVDYWYHMYGADIVALGLQLDSAGTWVNIDTIIGQQQTTNAAPFRLRSLDLSAYQGIGITTFRFWTVKGASFNGDVAIDDFRIYDTVGVNAQMDSIISPVSNCGLSASSSVTIKISNVGLSAISNFPVSYVLNGGTPVIETVTTTIIPGTSLVYTFNNTVNLQTVGSYTLEVTVSVPGDGNVLNDKKTGTIVSGFAQTLDQNNPTYSNDFEGATNNWVTYGTNNSWEIGTPSTFYINKASNGTKAYVTSAAGNHNANEMSYIETPCFDLTSFVPTTPFDISFKTLFKTQSDSDRVWMEMTLNNGATWTKVLATPSASINFYNNTTSKTWTGFSSAGAGNYIPVLNTITGIGGNSQVKFRFAFKSNGTNENDGFAVDEFRIGTLVGLNEQTEDVASFNLFPNPAKENVTISFNNVETGNYELTIEDVKGQKVVNEVISINNSNSIKEINISQFENGVYFVRLINGSSIVTKKLVVN
jgi:hypothetical protein